MMLRSVVIAGLSLLAWSAQAGVATLAQSDRDAAPPPAATVPTPRAAPPPGMLVNPPTPMVRPAPGEDVPGCSVRQLKPLDLLV